MSKILSILKQMSKDLKKMFANSLKLCDEVFVCTNVISTEAFIVLENEGELNDFHIKPKLSNLSKAKIQQNSNDNREKFTQL